MTSPGARYLGAGAAAIPLVAVVAGTVDAVFGIARSTELDAGLGEVLLAIWSSSALVSLVVLPVCLGLGVAMSVAPMDLGLVGLRRGVARLVGARGAEAAWLSARLWSSGLAVLTWTALSYKIAHTVMLTFHNERLMALLIAAAVLVAAAVALVVYWGARRLLEIVLTKVAGDHGRSLAWPIIPVVLTALVGLAAFAAIPVVYSETWDALDLRVPIGAVIVAVSSWATSAGGGLVLRKWSVGRTLGLGLLGLVVGMVALWVPTWLLFGTSEADAGIVRSVGEKGLLARVPLKALTARLDADGDGYSAVLGGGDCDDGAATVYPGASEILDNGVDEDCDGADLTLPPVEEDKPDPAADVDDGQAPAGDPLSKFRKRYNIVLVWVDTLRWDRVSYVGYERETTPNFDAIAERGTIFDNAYSVSAKTSQAIPPILAARFPSEMPRTFKHFVEYDDENLFLAEMLAEEGYLTSASGTHYYHSRKYGYFQGFHRVSTFKVPGDDMERVPTGHKVTDRAIEMLEAMAAGKLADKGEDDSNAPEPKPWDDAAGKRPWFLMVHYYDPHKHYIDHKGIEPFGRSASDRYDGEIRYTDREFGRLKEKLEEVDPNLANTVFIFLSDHGEAFGEHDMRFHGWDLYEHQIRIPWFFYLPGGEAQRIKTRVSAIDLVPTLLDILEIDPPEVMRGRSLLPQLALGKPLEPAPVFTEMPPGPYNVHFRSLTVGDLKLIHRLHGNYFRYFDLSEDPGELKDLWKKNPEQAKKLRDTYNVFRAQHVVEVEARK